MRNRISRLLSPPRFPNDAEKDRVANLLNIILLVLTAVFIVNTIIAFFFNPDFGATLINGATVLITFGLLLTLRARKISAAAWATVIIFWALVVGVTFFVSGLSVIIITSFFVLVVLAGVVAGNRAAVLILVLNLITSGIAFSMEQSGQLVPLMAGTPLINIAASAGNMVVLTLLIGLTLRALNKTLTEARAANQELQDAQILLETRVAERTRDLSLAAEVGRNLAQVRDLNTLLQNAAELIKERFGLYHVQIYLTDRTQQILVLSSGTGQAAAELLSRRHSLVIAPGSINGSAAMQKKPVVVPDTLESKIFTPNPLLPNTRSTLAVPLLLGERVVGVLDLQSADVKGLSEDSVPAFEAVASQLAISIDNANLFTEVQQAREEVESYVQRLTREGWEDYLDAISRDEKLAFVYDSRADAANLSEEITPISADKNALELPIAVANETVGVIQVEADDDRHWTEEALNLVSTVAQQVAQQVESIRLLDEAQRFRHEAETAVRRLTHEGWRDQLDREQALLTGYAYNQNRVKPFATSAEANGGDVPAVTLPLRIHGETIGSIDVHGQVTPDTEEIYRVVSVRLAEHLENLRLSSQTEYALGVTEALYQGIQQIVRANSVDGVLQQLVEFTHLKQFDRHNIILFDQSGDDSLPVSGFMAALLSEDGQPPQIPVGARFKLARFPAAKWFSREEPALIRDISGDERLDDNIRQVMPVLKTRGLAIFPLVASGQWLGVVMSQSNAPVSWSREQVRQTLSLVDQAAAVIQSIRLLAETQQQAQRETTVNLITQKIQSTLTVEDALKTAVSELGKALRASSAQVEIMPLEEVV